MMWFTRSFALVLASVAGAGRVHPIRTASTRSQSHSTGENEDSSRELQQLQADTQPETPQTLKSLAAVLAVTESTAGWQSVNLGPSIAANGRRVARSFPEMVLGSQKFGTGSFDPRGKPVPLSSQLGTSNTIPTQPRTPPASIGSYQSRPSSVRPETWSLAGSLVGSSPYNRNLAGSSGAHSATPFLHDRSSRPVPLSFEVGASSAVGRASKVGDTPTLPAQASGAAVVSPPVQAAAVVSPSLQAAAVVSPPPAGIPGDEQPVFERHTPEPHDLVLRVARGQKDYARTPVWMMRQAGRYMKAFRAYSEVYPFRQRSETPEMAIELSLQCWRKYGMDAVIFFSDILTPLPALGIEFDVVRGKGPVIPGDLAHNLEDRLYGPNPIRAVTNSEDFVSTHGFVRETLQSIRRSTHDKATLLGFVGAPWTLAAYSVEGGSTKEAALFKRWMYEKPEVADELLKRVAVSIANYAIFQAQSGAQAIQIFDSWAHCMTPAQWSRFAAPHVKHVAKELRAAFPDMPILYFANGGSSYLSSQITELKGIVDVLSLDQGIRMADAAQLARGSGIVLQGNIDPYILKFGSEAEIREAVRKNIDEAGGPGQHILNLGHGVMQGTPEENVGYLVEEAQNYRR